MATINIDGCVKVGNVCIAKTDGTDVCVCEPYDTIANMLLID